MEEFAKYPSCQKLADLSIEKFSNLTRNSENDIEQWSVLSTIIQYNKTTKESKVVALGTGTKCIGVNKMSPDGIILNDSHAEVMCRRSFIRYIYYNVMNENQFDFNSSKLHFELNSNISFHFFSTHPPCGDATIMIEEGNEIQSDPVIPIKRIKIDSDYVCTGAKLLGVIKGIASETGQKNDPLYQEEGALRTKPGRGVRTLSMSCSDKLSKWNILGVQGALLDSLLEKPIYFKTLNFCGETQKESLERALFKRWKHKEFTNDRFTIQKPEIRINNKIIFHLAKVDNKKASPRSICWCDIPENEKPFETSVNGMKEGVTKKTLEKCPSNGALQISKLKLSKNFIGVVQKYPSLKEKFLDENIKCTKIVNYQELKKLCKLYQNAWSILKCNYFGKWTKKENGLLNFKIEL